jgi:o-succinylbenzoate synthase
VRLAGFGLYHYRLRLCAPLELKGTVLHHREGLLVELVGAGGAIGWGEASPLAGFSRESLGDAARHLRALAARVAGREMTGDWLEPDGGFARELDAVEPSPSARFGFELALWSLFAAARRESLAELLAPRPRATVPVSALLSGPREEVLQEARRARDAGYEAIKLKVGVRSAQEDAVLVRALSVELGGKVALRLDANRAWSFGEAKEFVRATEGVRLEYLEEPLADAALLPSLASDYGVPVALDESLTGMEPEGLEDHAYARTVVLKPTLLGGISRTMRFARRASRLGIVPVISSAYETGVGTAALVALASGVGGERVAAGLDTYRRLAEDFLRPCLELPAPRVDVRVAAGLRHEVRRDRLKLLARL